VTLESPVTLAGLRALQVLWSISRLSVQCRRSFEVGWTCRNDIHQSFQLRVHIFAIFLLYLVVRNSTVCFCCFQDRKGANLSRRLLKHVLIGSGLYYIHVCGFQALGGVKRSNSMIRYGQTRTFIEAPMHSTCINLLSLGSPTVDFLYISRFLSEYLPWLLGDDAHASQGETLRPR
jgi:hypothetical protein